MEKNFDLLKKKLGLENFPVEHQFTKVSEELEKRKKEYNKNLEEIEDIKNKIESILKNENTEQKNPSTTEEERKIEDVVTEATETIEEENLKIIDKKLSKLETSLEEKSSTLSTNLSKKLNRWYLKYIVLPISILTAVLSTYNSPQDYYDMFKNWKERHIDKIDVDDPSIVGINTLYKDSLIFTERSTYDFLGGNKIEYKSGYYMTSVFDLTDKTPPRFKLINDRENYGKIDSAAGITTSLFEKFQNWNDFRPKLKGHTEKEEAKSDIPVIGYNLHTQQIKAGHYGEFNENWLVSETYEIHLDFKLNEDSTINLTYPTATLRMCPITTREDGKQIPFPIGVTRDKSITRIKPSECTRFGVLEGGKVIMVCGEKQLQVNGSFADMFNVYERLKKEYNAPVQAYLLDNGSYNLPIWNKDEILTPEEIREHMKRHYGGGTALVLINDNKISPYEYKNRYKEFEHYTPNFTLDTITNDKPAVNEKSVIVLHHTGNYKDPNIIIRKFKEKDTIAGVSSHVLILKDGTRHLFNTDDYVLAHAGKSDFNNKNKVNFFSLGIELEGDSKDGQFTIAQLESLLEYLRPRVEKYKIPLENITTHKIIRENYIKKHPKEDVLTKRDLEDKVWQQIKELIEKKLYQKRKVELNNKSGKLIGALIYQEAYRNTANHQYATIQAKKVLKYYNISSKQANYVTNWIKNRV